MRPPSFYFLALALLVVLTGCHREERGATAPPVESQKADAVAGGPAAGTGEDRPDSRPLLPIPDLGYNAREGRTVYRHYCGTCHGKEGHGDGFNAYNLDPRPRDLADPAFQAQRSDEDLAAIIRSGGGVAGLSTGMPPWGRTLNQRQIRNVVDFLRTLPRATE